MVVIFYIVMMWILFLRIGEPIITSTIILLGASVLFITIGFPKFKKLGIWIGLINVGSILFFYKQFFNELANVYNSLALALSNKNRVSLPTMTVNDSISDIGLCLVILSVGVVLLFLIEWMYLKQLYLGFLTLFLLCWTVQVITGLYSSPVLNTVLALATLVIMINSKSRTNQKLPFSLIFSGILAMLMLIWFSQETYKQPLVFENVQERTVNAMMDFRFKRNTIDYLTEGNLWDVKTRNDSDEIALNIALEQPTSMYLKGFVGETYLDGEWSPLHKEIYATEYNRLHALEKNNFTAALQLSTPMNMDSTNVKIQIVNASKKYAYLPYELASFSSKNFQTNDFSTYTANSFFGTEQLSFEIMPTIEKSFPIIAETIYDNAQEQSISSYLINESFYNEYVYKYETLLDEDTKLLLSQHVENIDVQTERLEYKQAINYVQKFLENNLTYNENIEPLTSDKDYLQYLLEQNNAGYAPHYATVATLLFRFLQIPARYVEGYIISSQDVKGMEGFSEVSITGKNAHSWTEIYIDAIGWVPIETTPPYLELMPQIMAPKYSEEMQKVKPQFNSIENQTIDDTPQYVREDEIEHLTESTLKDVKVWWEIIFILILLALILLIVRTRRFKLKGEQAILAMYDDMHQLLAYKKIIYEGGSSRHIIPLIESEISTSGAELYESAVVIVQQILYSPEPLTEHQQREMKTIVQDFKREIAKSNKPLSRLAFYVRYAMKL